jgi:hypothetical protein
MKGFVTNIEDDTIDNEDFRRVLYTAKNTQLVLMNLRGNEEIGEEIHELDQFIALRLDRASRSSTESRIDFPTVRRS